MKLTGKTIERFLAKPDPQILGSWSMASMPDWFMSAPTSWCARRPAVSTILSASRC
jgi:hypothetical protein